jgi:ribosome-associated translation inhibitor RaiA
MMAASGSASTMRIRVQGRHMEATPSIKEFVEEKVTKVRQWL